MAISKSTIFSGLSVIRGFVWIGAGEFEERKIDALEFELISDAVGDSSASLSFLDVAPLRSLLVIWF